MDYWGLLGLIGVRRFLQLGSFGTLDFGDWDCSPWAVSQLGIIPQFTVLTSMHGWLSKLWSPLLGRCRTILRTQNKTTILTTTHMFGADMCGSSDLHIRLHSKLQSARCQRVAYSWMHCVQKPRQVIMRLR